MALTGEGPAVLGSRQLVPPMKARLSAIKKLLPTIGFRNFHADLNINYQLNRALIPGLDAEFARIGAAIRNFDDWKSLFLSAAISYENDGRLSEASGLYRAAEFFMNPSDPDRVHAFEKFIALFYQANVDPHLQQIQVPFAEGVLHGLRLTPDCRTRGTILIHAGFDAYIEHFYAMGKAIALEGYDVVMFDGPGQGSTLMRGKMPMTAKWEGPVGAVLDHLALTDVTLIGISLGGYLALRAAAFDPRIIRVIAYDVMFDFFQCITSRRGKTTEQLIRFLVHFKLNPVLNAFAAIIMSRDLYSRWGITQGMHVMGCATPAAYFAALRAYNTRAISGQRTQDCLIMAGSEDHFVPQEQFFAQLRLLTSAKSVTGRIFTTAEHAQSHCQVGNLGLALYEILNWIDAHSSNEE